MGLHPSIGVASDSQRLALCSPHPLNLNGRSRRAHSRAWRLWLDAIVEALDVRGPGF